MAKGKAKPGIQWRDRYVETLTVRADEVLPHPLNPKLHPETQLAPLRDLLEEVGKLDALKAYRSPARDGALVYWDGHGRQELKPDETWRVDVYDLTDEEAALVIATFDPIAYRAQQDREKQRALLDGVDTKREALAAMLAEMRAALDAGEDQGGGGEPGDAEPQLDKAEELNQKWQVKSGDIWAVGGHRLLCGDSTKAGDVVKVLAGAEPNLMVTDPPYGVDYDANWRNEADRANGKPYGASAIGRVENDNVADWTPTWRLFKGNVAYVWHAGRHAKTVQQSLEAAGFEVRNQIIWAKSNFAISRGHYHWKHEPCWYVFRKGETADWIGDHSQTTLWEIDKPLKSETGHSTQKPLECMERPIRNHKGDVYEPFCGSGTTMIAAQNLNRKCYAIEISAEYCAVILQRMEDAFPSIKIERITS